MNKVFLIPILLLFTSLSTLSAQTPLLVTLETSDIRPRETVSIRPSVPLNYQLAPAFPGGLLDLESYFQSEFQYPPLALDHAVEGIVLLRLTIDATGKVDLAEVVRSLGFGCDEEAIRLANNMPDWQPARQGENTIPGRVLLPMKFSLR